MAEPGAAVVSHLSGPGQRVGVDIAKNVFQVRGVDARGGGGHDGGFVCEAVQGGPRSQ